jgi:hypothetical protein
MTHAGNDSKKESTVSHMVSYRSTDGKQSYHQIDELSDAIKYVEHLRNDEAVDQARIFKMEEVGFEFRPYYRVELADAVSSPPTNGIEGEWLSPQPDAEVAGPDDRTGTPDEDADPLAAAWSIADRGAPQVGEDESVGAGFGAGMGRRGLFGR